MDKKQKKLNSKHTKGLEEKANKAIKDADEIIRTSERVKEEAKVLFFL